MCAVKGRREVKIPLPSSAAALQGKGGKEVSLIRMEKERDDRVNGYTAALRRRRGKRGKRKAAHHAARNAFKKRPAMLR